LETDPDELNVARLILTSVGNSLPQKYNKITGYFRLEGTLGMDEFHIRSGCSRPSPTVF